MRWTRLHVHAALADIWRPAYPAAEFKLDRQMNSRVMYIELKSDNVRGPARIGRVEFSQTGKTLYYAGRKLAPLKGHGLKANYFDSETLEEFWISGPRADGTDSLYGATVEIDEDCRKEYWRYIRKQPNLVSSTSYKSPG